MQLTLHTDYALRVLLYLGLKGEAATVAEVSEFYEISRNHLTKVVQRLAAEGWVVTLRGKGGGVRLAEGCQAETVGNVVRRLEPNFHLVECHDPQRAENCAVVEVCRLDNVLAEARNAFLAHLDAITVGELVEPGHSLEQLRAAKGAAKRSR